MPDPELRLDQVNIVVRDMEAAVAFYRLLGVTIEDQHPAWDRHHRTAFLPDGFSFDLDTAASAKTWDARWPDGAEAGVVVGFRLPTRDAVDARYAELTEAGYRGRQAPWDTFWGARYAIVEDPSGNPVGLMSPVDPSRGGPPPPPPA